jgi:endonuclease/exonuclease/phosphatase family metal-dependent hydrolase
MAVRSPSVDRLEASEALKTFLANSSEWVLCPAFLFTPPGSDLAPETEIQIRLKDGRMDESYLCFLHSDTLYGIFPVSRLVTGHFEPTGHLIFTFRGYDEQHVIFLVEDSTDLELLVSQIRVCSPIGRPEDPFGRANALWFRRTVQDNDVYGEFCGQHRLLDIDSTGCALCPVPYWARARETWDRRCTALNQPFYTVFGSVRVTCLTWNVGSRAADDSVALVFEEVLLVGSDIVFLVFQEIDMGMVSVVTGTSPVAAEWSRKIHSCVSARYQVVERTLGGVFAMLLIGTDGIQIEDRDTKTMRLGSHGMTANKGAVFFHVMIGEDARIAFVGCHLTARAENMEGRNQELMALVARAETGADYVFLAGDLNYRVDLDCKAAVDMCNANAVQELLRSDQLTKCRTIEPRINDLKEAPILFLPTYKFNVGSDEYDDGPKQQTPSWTDRVLVKTMPPRLSVGAAERMVFETDLIRDQVSKDVLLTFQTDNYFSLNPRPELTYPKAGKFESYSRHQSQLSDHRPVSATVQLQIPKTDGNRLQEFLTLKNKKLDEMEDMRPQVTIHGEDMAAELVKSLKVRAGKKKRLVMLNKSAAWARWHVELTIPGALAVDPKRGVLVPGERETLTITGITVTSQPATILFMDHEKGAIGSLDVTVKRKSFF